MSTTTAQQQQVVVKGQKKWVSCVAFSPDGKNVAATNAEGRLWTVEASTGKLVWERRDMATIPIVVAWSHHGRLIAMGGWNGIISLCVAKTGKVISHWPGHKENITSIVFSADDRFLATGSGDDTAKVWSVRGGEALLAMEQGDEYDMTGVAFSPDSNRLATGDGENRVKIWDTRTGDETRVMEGHTEAVAAVAWSADGNCIAVSYTHLTLPTTPYV